MNHQMAQHIQSQGRGDDSVLVHMTPGEVSGLQALAMAHGGSLTINPETGLAEAGFLKSLLPMILGAIATPLTGGPRAFLSVGAPPPSRVILSKVLWLALARTGVPHLVPLRG